MIEEVFSMIEEVSLIFEEVFSTIGEFSLMPEEVGKTTWRACKMIPRSSATIAGVGRIVARAGLLGE